MLLTDIAIATGNHDGFVVAPYFRCAGTRRCQFKAAEVAAKIGATKLVIERRGANGPL